MNPTGYIRQRGGMLEAVVQAGEVKTRHSTGYKVGQEDLAEKFLADLLREMGAGAPEAAPATSPEELTLREWAERWVKERRARGIVSVADEESQLRYHVLPELGAVPLRQLTKAQLLAWVHTLKGRQGVDSDKPLASRTINHIAGTVKRLLKAATKIDLIPVNPAVWDKTDLPKKRDVNVGKRRHASFKAWEVWALLHDERVPRERRVLYGIEFLTGLRTGEASTRRWSDLDLDAKPLARLEAKTAWNSRAKLEKGTKTDVEKVVPVHPALRELLVAWKAEGWKEYVGREPKPDDLIVPSERGARRGASHSNKLFQDDVRNLGLVALDSAGRPVTRTHYETRSTFRSLALGGGAVERDLNRITHPSPKEASDLYTRMDALWPVMCQAVLCIHLAPKEAEAPPSGEVTVQVTATGEMPVVRAEKKKTLPSHGDLAGSHFCSELARDTGFESGAFAGETRRITLARPHVRAPSGVTSASASGGTSTGGSDLPNALACHIESTAMFAAQAAERGDLEAAKELLHSAVRAV
ncbi:MAG: hypothetical protein RJA59_1176, partial [Pseudomonadota bacterium]